MAKTGKHHEKLRNIMLSCDSFTTGYSCMILLFFVPYCIRYGGMILLACMPVVCLVPFVVMPVIYCAVHKFNPLLFGRYHLVMPVAAALAALFFAAAFSSEKADASGACMIFFGSLIFAVSLATYRYCAFSVRARLIGEGVEKRSLRSLCIAAAGAASAAATALCFYNADPETAFSSSAFVTAAMCMITATIQYLASYYDIPRLGGKRTRSVKSAFRMLYSGLNKRRYFAALFAPAAFVSATSLLVIYAPTRMSLFASASAVVAAFIVGAFAVRASVPKFVYDIGRAAIVAAAALLGIGIAVPPSAAEICTIVAAALLGIGGAISWRGSAYELLCVKRRVTSGTVCLLTELTAYAAAAIGLAVAAAVCGLYFYVGGENWFAYGFAAAGALAAVSIVLANIKRKKNGDDGARSVCDTTIDDGLNRLLYKNDLAE